ncbi:MAG: four helix bundle protein [Deltaproteobacteria bacterium]|nr:four helix bundle protein [Deltaproteobacteria bacterium]
MNEATDSSVVLSFQKLRVYQRSIFRASQPRNIAEGAGRRTAVDQARFYTHARGSAMEAAASLDTMRVMKLIDEHRCSIGIGAMLTKMT